MIEINTIIVEDFEISRRIIREGIEMHNRVDTKYHFKIVAEAVNYEEAKAILSIKADIKLIFLDIRLPVAPTGLKLIKEFSDISYIVVSKDDEFWDEMINETESRPHGYVRKISEGNINIGRVVKALQKFLREKSDNFYKSHLNYNGYQIAINQTLCISRPVLKVQMRADEKGFEVVKLGQTEGSNDHHYFCRNHIKSLASIASAQILDSIDIPGNDPVLSLDNIITSFELNPNKLIRISDSIILNLEYVESYDPKHKLFTVKVCDFFNPVLRINQEISALLKGSSNPKFLFPEIEQMIMEAISDRFYRL